MDKLKAELVDLINSRAAEPVKEVMKGFPEVLVFRSPGATPGSSLVTRLGPDWRELATWGDFESVLERLRDRLRLMPPVPEGPQYSDAADILRAGLKHMDDRAAMYDAPQGERSMAKTVAAFNALTGFELTEELGWLFMICLKAARSQQGAFRADNFEDGAAYFGLYGEAAAKRAEG